jgi:tetratricopeptide (TPR) repeat protein
MKQKKISSPVLFSFVLTCLFCCSLFLHPESETIGKLEGLVLQGSGKGIENARIVIIFDSHDQRNEQGKEKIDPSGSGPGHVVYSNRNGEWDLDIPKCDSFRLFVYANAYETVQKRLVFDEWFKDPSKLVFILTESLSHVLWGSFEHIQLYVQPIHQKNIEFAIEVGGMAAVDEYLSSRMESKERRHGLLFAGYLFFENSKHEKSKTCFEKAGSTLWFNLMGDFLLKEKRYKEALKYYIKGETTKNRAYNLLRLARTFEKQGDWGNAQSGYGAALADFKSLLNSVKYKWSSDYVDKTNLCSKKLGKNSAVSREPETNKKLLKTILEKAGKYCQIMDKTKIYYYCLETKRDNVLLIKKLARALENPAGFFKHYSPIKLRGGRITDYYKYDLQYIKESNGTVNENRKLLIENLDNSNPGIPVLSYSITEALHGPHTLIGFGWQQWFHYKILSREVLFDEEVVVLGVVPRSYNTRNRMSGKIWISKRNGSVLKIEWHHRGIQNREQLRALGFILERDPELRFISEFAKKKGDLRFPSKCRMVESYTNDEGDRFVRLEVKINYNKYQFFMVSSQVELKNI